MEQDTTPTPLGDLTITGCARCGGHHEHVVVREMVRPFAPPEADGLAWTHWAPCPANGDPILIVVEPPHALQLDDRELTDEEDEEAKSTKVLQAGDSLPRWARHVPMPDPPVSLDGVSRPRPPPTYLPGPGEPIQMPIAGQGVSRYQRVAPTWAVWLIPVGVGVLTILAILCGALWR